MNSPLHETNLSRLWRFEDFKFGVLNTTQYKRDRAYRPDNDNKIINGHWCSRALDSTVQ